MSSEMGLFYVCVLLLCCSSFTNANLAPDLLQLSYSVCESVPVGQVAFTLEGSDPENDPLTYALEDIDAKYFRVEPNTGTVYVDASLDRESKTVMSDLRVIIYDPFQSASFRIYVVIDDANDNRPIFEEASYETTVLENESLAPLCSK
ncbi:hypothetical protein WMY93_009496 [Mugilogobius chulae]|uniref:Cadherin domain-containing protein n=1 Tax=Mugilogobius chulae TaxID=88201 RepID=A0AAW0PBP2_9GOBI